MDSLKILQAINLAIWIRDNGHLISRKDLMANIEELAGYGIFSSRQLQKICRNRISYTTISRRTGKSSKTGGNINPDSLETIRDVLYAKHNGQINYLAISSILADGTSQGMVSRLTGVAQSTISKRLGGNGGETFK